MPIDFNVVFGGEAGSGIQSLSYIVGKTLMRGGYEVYADQDFESRIRGGHSFTRIRAADHPVQAHSEKANVVIALNRETIDLHKDELKPGGVLIYDDSFKLEKTASNGFLAIQMEKLAIDTVNNKVMSNTVAAGAALGLIDYDFELLAGVLREEFGRKDKQIGEDNVRAARAGYDYAQQHRDERFTQRLGTIGKSTKLLMSGHQAVALGAMAAGCKFVAGYPMTPTTTIMEYIADNGRQFDIPVVQAEDEISAMNMVIGAAYTGVRAMTATSGGGFCLMVEGLSLAGMTETPVVVVLGQRPGPAIGLPTRTEQGELLFAINAGHGEFPRAVLAPTGVTDAFWLTVKAFNLAEKYQTPVIVLTDHDLANTMNSADRFDLSQVKIDRGLLLSDETLNGVKDYKRYQFTESGVSPRALPMQSAALVSADSDEHNEEGHIIEDAETRSRMVEKRMRKTEGLRREIGAPYIQRKVNAEFTLIGFGSTYGPIKEAAEMLEAEKVAVNTLQLSEVWPFPAETVASVMNNGAKNLVIENNAGGQLARLIRQETGIKADRQIHKYDGRPFSPADIVNALKKETR